MMYEGGSFAVADMGEEVRKIPKNHEALQRACQIHNDLRDIQDIEQVYAKDGFLTQRKVQGERLEGDALQGEMKERFQEWKEDFTKRVRAKGYEPKGLGTEGNVFYENGKFVVVDVESFKPL